MFALVGKLVVNVFIFIILGIVIGRLAGQKGERILKFFIWFAVYLLIPFFVITSLWMSPLSIAESKEVAFVALAVVLGGTLFVKAWVYIKGISFRDYCLPVIFMNSAYLGIPVNMMLWGKQAVFYTIVYSAVVSIINFSVGVWWVSRKKSVAEILKLPFLYSILIGVILNVMSVKMPPFILESNNIVSAAALPAMLIFSGYRLGKIKPYIFSQAFIGVFLRMGGGWLVAFIMILVLKLTGPVAGVCLITSSMPSAVNNYILAERFNSNAEFTSASIFIGTALTIITIPLTGYFLLNYFK